jgi:hypothetical protein
LPEHASDHLGSVARAGEGCRLSGLPYLQVTAAPQEPAARRWRFAWNGVPARLMFTRETAESVPEGEEIAGGER